MRIRDMHSKYEDSAHRLHWLVTYYKAHLV